VGALAFNEIQRRGCEAAGGPPYRFRSRLDVLERSAGKFGPAFFPIVKVPVGRPFEAQNVFLRFGQVDVFRFDGHVGRGAGESAHRGAFRVLAVRFDHDREPVSGNAHQ
jgi:hypothetical protein